MLQAVENTVAAEGEGTTPVAGSGILVVSGLRGVQEKIAPPKPTALNGALR